MTCPEEIHYSVKSSLPTEDAVKAELLDVEDAVQALVIVVDDSILVAEDSVEAQTIPMYTLHISHSWDKAPENTVVDTVQELTQAQVPGLQASLDLAQAHNPGLQRPDSPNSHPVPDSSNSYLVPDPSHDNPVPVITVTLFQQILEAKDLARESQQVQPIQ